jgi:endonuclease/exonuclease/phosphatase family metal-dependent hydrolase
MAAAAATYDQVRATDFPARARALAGDVARFRPALIGLQEVALWRSGPLHDPAPGTQVELDFLAILLAELAARRQHYAVAAQQRQIDAEAPAGAPYLRDLRITDRDVILARTDLPARRFRTVNARGGRFRAALSGAGLRLTRGWASVDVRVRGRRALRFVTTHLEPASEAVKRSQARELVAGPLATRLPVVLTGDLNSDPRGTGSSRRPSSAAYDIVAAAGLRGTGNRANTCCHANSLLNAVPTLSSRIDVVLTRPAVRRTVASRLLGAHPSERVPSAAGLLWPSDHAGLVVGRGVCGPSRPRRAQRTRKLRSCGAERSAPAAATSRSR